MQNSITWVGMDVHAENIVLAAVCGISDVVVFRAEFPNTPKGRERLAGRLQPVVRCPHIPYIGVLPYFGGDGNNA